VSAHQDFAVEQREDVVASRAIRITLAAAMAITVIAIVVAGLMLKQQRGTIGARGAPPNVAPTQIQGIHQTPIERERHGLELREAQQLWLEKYGWVDREHGIARIPIERAIDLVVAGSPAAAPAIPPGPAPSGSGGPQK
jgi:hypothetical protein